MKKAILLLFAGLIFLACEDTETNSTALQANLNASFFKAYSVSAQANNTDQMITIIGTSDHEEFILHTEWKGATVYEVGQNKVNYATFKNADDKMFTTNYQGSTGTITITNQDKESQQLTGEFDFTFITHTDTIAVSRGFFYAVPYEIVDVVLE